LATPRPRASNIWREDLDLDALQAGDGVDDAFQPDGAEVVASLVEQLRVRDDGVAEVR
jgi:hypothetical protein